MVGVKRVRHETWLCDCAVCKQEQERVRNYMRRMRRRLYDEEDTDVDHQVVVNVLE